MTSEPSLGEIIRTLGKIEARLDRVLADHETRLRRIERWVYAIPATIIVAAASVASAIINN